MLGAGESARDVVATLRPGAVRVIAVNRSFELAPWAEVLYAGDASFWRHYPGARVFDGWRFCADDYVHYFGADIHPVTIARGRDKLRLTAMIRQPVGTIGFGGNSGFQAVNLAAQFGASRILLCLDYRGKHWHPDHPPALRNPSDGQLGVWARDLDKQAGTLKSWGIEVVNVAKNSSLRAYPYADCNLFNSKQCPLSA